MIQTNLVEKLKIVLEVSKSSKLFIAVIGFIIALVLVAFTTTKKNANKAKIFYGLIYTAVIITIMVLYHESLGKMFDYMMDNFFIVLYFPNIAIYLAAIIATNIILLISIFNFKIPKLVKSINIIFYAVIHYLLALILNIITTKELDVFSQISIYGNKDAQALIELSSTIFIIWLAFLLLYKIIRIYQIKTKASNIPEREEREYKLPDTIIQVPVPKLVKSDHKKNTSQRKEDLTFITTLLDEQKLEKALLEQELEEASEKLRVAEEQLAANNLIIKTQDEENTKIRLEIDQKLKSAEEKISSYEEIIKTQDAEYTKIKLETDRKLKLAEEKIQSHEETIRNKDKEQQKLEQEQSHLQYEQIILQQEKAKLQQENEKLQEANIEVLDVRKNTPVDRATAIMNNLDTMFTLEDYKVLATILKAQQKKKNEQKLRDEIKKQEQLKFASLHEAYRSAR